VAQDIQRVRNYLEFLTFSITFYCLLGNLDLAAFREEPGRLSGFRAVDIRAA